MAAAGGGGLPPEEEVQASTFPSPPYWYKLYGSSDPEPPKPPAPRLGKFQVFEREFDTVRDWLGGRAPVLPVCPWR